MTMFISTKIIMTTGMTERTFSKNRMLICICTSPSPMITRTCRNCITDMVTRIRKETSHLPVSPRAAEVGRCLFYRGSGWLPIRER